MKIKDVINDNNEDEGKCLKNSEQIHKHLSTYITDITGILTIIGFITIPKQIIEYYLLMGIHSYFGLKNSLFTIKWNFWDYWNQNIISIFALLLLILFSYVTHMQWNRHAKDYEREDSERKIGVTFISFFSVYSIFNILLLFIGIFNEVSFLLPLFYMTIIIYMYLVSVFKSTFFSSGKNNNRKKNNLIKLYKSITIPIVIGCLLLLCPILYFNWNQDSFVQQGQDILKSVNEYSILNKNDTNYVLFETTNNEKIIIEIKHITNLNDTKVYKLVAKGTYQYLTKYDELNVKVEYCIIDNGDYYWQW
ncbi:MAG: hypothetical protein ACLSVX_02180 [Massilimicrobiota timonensis]